MKTENRYYLINPKGKPTGTNRVDFVIVGNRVSVNHCPLRFATPDEIQSLLNAEKRTMAALAI